MVTRDDDLVGDVRRVAAADWTFYVARLNGPVDRADWSMTPQTNDAYNGSLRDIVFPAGILQPPIFDADADPAVNYGAVGGVIGHEITHGFDDQGRKIDAEGRLRDWWTPEDAAKFETRAKRLGAQYSAFEPLPGVHVNGALTMGENIADVGGLTVALDAYHASLGGRPAPVIDGLTGDQRVMLGWAQAWRGKVRDDALRRQVVSDGSTASSGTWTPGTPPSTSSPASRSTPLPRTVSASDEHRRGTLAGPSAPETSRTYKALTDAHLRDARYAPGAALSTSPENRRSCEMHGQKPSPAP